MSKIDHDNAESIADKAASNKKTSSKAHLLLYFILVIETIIIKIVQLNFLPEKYLYDSEKVLAIMNGSTITDKAFSFAAGLFNNINFLGFNSVAQWNILISVIMLLFFIWFFRKRELNKRSSLFIITSYALMSLFVFNLGKDIIQLAFFLIIYFVCKKKNGGEIKKILITAGILLFEALLFRTYYLVVGALFVSICFLIKTCFKKENSKKKQGTIFITAIVLFLLMIYVLQKISMGTFAALADTRTNSNMYRDKSNAVTIINDVFPNTNFSYFALNYIINTIRILFPLELLSISYSYIPFVLYQLFFTAIIMRSSSTLRGEKYIYYSLAIALIMVSAIFEPDFGSVVRHESVLLPFTLELIDGIRNKRK